jgi:hypothetical protein
MDSSARFCRKCGHPSGMFEAQTQKFDAPPQSVQTSPTNFAPTGAAYMPPGPMSAPGAITQGIKPSSTRPLLILLAVVMGVLLMVGGLFFLYQVVYRGSAGADQPSAGQAPPMVPPAGRPGRPEIPAPPAPPESGSGETDGPLQAYIYPGSVKTMDFSGHGKGVIQLTTRDPVDKVTDWYRAKLKPSKIAQIPFGAATVMEGKDVKAIITGSGNGTMVMLTKGDD